MKTSNTLVWLSWLIAVLALAAASIGLFWQDDRNPFPFTTIRGQAVQIWGQGLYRFDSLFFGAGNKGTDLVTLVLGIPLLVVASLLHRHGLLRGGLLLTGTLAYFLYMYASYALGAVAFNELFFLYVALFSASFYAFVLSFVSIDLQALPPHFSRSLPRLGPAVFMFASGLVTLVVWAGPVLSAQLQGQPPEGLDHYTTMFTYALDLAIITPATFVSGALILRRDSLGYLMALSMLVLEAMLAPMIAAQTVSQIAAGVSFSPGQIIGPIPGFTVLSLVAIWVMATLLCHISDRAPL
jgi:hypothetical protein